LALEPRATIPDEGLGELLDPRVVREVLAAFTEVTGLPVTVRDGEGRFFGSPTALPRWCALLRRSSFGFEGCQQAAVDNCPREPGRVAEYVCHEAVCHLSAAVVVEGRVLAQLVLGPFVNFPLPDRIVGREAERHGVPVDALLASRREIKWVPQPRARAAARLLVAVANAFARMATDAQERARLALLVDRPRHQPRPRRPEPGRRPQVLIVEADLADRRALSRALEAGGFRVRAVGTGQEAMAALDLALPDVVLVSPQVCDAPGFQLCHLIRRSVDLPIVILSSVGDENSVVEALEQYAEDYVVKPVSDRELVARLRRVVRRADGPWIEPGEAATVVDDRLTIHFGQREAVVDGRSVKLTPTECRILGSLARRANRAVPAELLLREAWPDGDGDPTQLWVHVRSLRRKIEPDPASPRYLTTRRGQGYVLTI